MYIYIHTIHVHVYIYLYIYNIHVEYTHYNYLTNYIVWIYIYIYIHVSNISKNRSIMNHDPSIHSIFTPNLPLNFWLCLAIFPTLWHLPELLAVGLVRLCPGAPLPQQLQGLVGAEAIATHQKGCSHCDAAVHTQTAVHQNTALLKDLNLFRPQSNSCYLNKVRD